MSERASPPTSALQYKGHKGHIIAAIQAIARVPSTRATLWWFDGGSVNIAARQMFADGLAWTSTDHWSIWGDR